MNTNLEIQNAANLQQYLESLPRDKQIEEIIKIQLILSLKVHQIKDVVQKSYFEAVAEQNDDEFD